MGTKSRAFMGMHKYLAENKTADRLLSIVFYGGIGGAILSCLGHRRTSEYSDYAVLRSAVDRAVDPQHPDYAAFDHAFDTKHPHFAALRSGHPLDTKGLADYAAYCRSRLNGNLAHNHQQSPPKN